VQRVSRRLVAAAAALVIGAFAALPVSAPVTAETSPARPSDVSKPPGLQKNCLSEYTVAVQRGTDVSRIARDGYVVFDRVKVPVTADGLRTAADLAPPDSSWKQWFHALVWLLPLALDRPGLAADLAVRHADALPDPGALADTETQQRMGWTSGNIRNRLEVMRCLYRITGDQRLFAIGRDLGDSLLDPNRYPGWPLSKPHNHGILTNQVMIGSARAFERPEWIRVSYQRLRKDLPGVFSRCGMVYEQSTGYHALNVSLWSDFPDLASKELVAAQSALAALIRPDGVLEMIGNGQGRVGRPSGGRLWCAATGWAANTVGGMHYILRFGPATDGHGHSDHGAPTWFTAGIPVLSDRGLFDKVRDARRDYATGMSAHSVLEPVGVAGFNPVTSGRRTGANSYALRDDTLGISRTRTLRFDRRELTVTDVATSYRTGASGQQWIQHWHLAPGWRPTEYGARHPSGRRLIVRCSGGVLSPRAVEAYPAWRTAVRAWDLQCRATGSTVRLTTTLRVR
jgi:hypothetical protein